MGPETLRKSVR